MSEIEAASDLRKKLEHLKPGDEQNIFTADELNTLWRVAIAKARTRITHDTQLPFHCLDLAKQQLVSRSNDALVRLLCVIHSAQAAGHQKEIRDFIRAFIRSLVRELLDHVFSEQAQQVMRSHAFKIRLRIIFNHCMIKDDETWINDELIEDVWGEKLDVVGAGAFSFCTLHRASCSPWSAVLERRCEVRSCESENWSGLWHLGTCSVELKKRKFLQEKWDTNFWAGCRGLGIRLGCIMNEWNAFAFRGISESPCNLELLFKLRMPKTSFLTCHFWCSMECSPFTVLKPAMWKEAPLPLKLLPALQFSVVLRLLAYMHSSKGKIFIPIEEVRLGYANQICDLLAQLLRKLPEPPPEIYGFCAFAVLQGALLALAINKPSSSGIWPDEYVGYNYCMSDGLNSPRTIGHRARDSLDGRDWLRSAECSDDHQLRWSLAASVCSGDCEAWLFRIPAWTMHSLQPNWFCPQSR